MFSPRDILFFKDLAEEEHRTVNVKGVRMLAHLGVSDNFDVSEFER